MLPNREEFDALASAGALAPIWTELLADVSTPVGVFPALAGDGPGVLLESVERSERWGRYSFVAGDPAAVVVLDEDGLHVHDVVRDLGFDVRSTGNARRDLVSLATRLRAPRVDGLPSLTGGLVGFLSYEAAQLVDGHPVPPGETPAPPIGLLVVDRAIVFDHWRQRLLLVAHVPAGGYDGAVDALEELSDRVSSPAAPPPEPLGDGLLDSGGGDANMTDDHFRDIVRTMKEHVFAGDVYQVVPSRRVSFTSSRGGLPVYRRLRVTNPAPYMFF
ncbi:MAG: chorismate-binding protein, partial [Actinomycetota bacterium]